MLLEFPGIYYVYHFAGTGCGRSSSTVRVTDYGSAAGLQHRRNLLHDLWRSGSDRLHQPRDLISLTRCDLQGYVDLISLLQISWSKSGFFLDWILVFVRFRARNFLFSLLRTLQWYQSRLYA